MIFDRYKASFVKDKNLFRVERRRGWPWNRRTEVRWAVWDNDPSTPYFLWYTIEGNRWGGKAKGRARRAIHREWRRVYNVEWVEVKELPKAKALLKETHQ